MSTSLYDVSVASYLQVLGGVQNVLEKGEQHARAAGRDPDELVRLKLNDDMAPLSFQVVSVWHHSLGAIEGIKAGLFQPPPKLTGVDYPKVKALVAEAISGLKGFGREEVDALADKPMVFKLGNREIPFSTDSFILSFSLPNFYFHAATAYDLLRIEGVPLGKMDYLGQLRIAS